MSLHSSSAFTAVVRASMAAASNATNAIFPVTAVTTPLMFITLHGP
jgi:hypothetical protein